MKSCSVGLASLSLTMQLKTDPKAEGRTVWYWPYLTRGVLR
jgi:hypothetical protein